MQRLVQLPVASIELAGGTVARGLAVGGVEDPHHCVVRVRRRGRGSLAPRPCSASVFRRRWRSSFARKRRLRSLLGWSCSAGGFSLRSRSWRGTSGTGRRRLLATPGAEKKEERPATLAEYLASAGIRSWAPPLKTLDGEAGRGKSMTRNYR